MRYRPAAFDDWARLYAWRNDPHTRAMSKRSEPVPLAEHLRWLRESLCSPHVRIFVATDETRSAEVGTFRLSRLEGRVECSVTVSPTQRGRGYGSLLAAAARDTVARLREEQPAAWDQPLRAQVRSDNHASLCAFAAAGFVPMEPSAAVAIARSAWDYVDLEMA